MQQKKLFVGALVTVSTLALFAGCQQAAPAVPAKPPEEVIKDGMAKLTDITSYAYEVALNADITDPTTGKVKFDVNLGGALDIKDKKDPKMTLKVDGSGSDDKGNGGSGNFEVRLNKDAVYFEVMKLALTGENSEIPKEVTDMFGKWWKITIPPGSFDELEASLPQGSSEEMTPEQKKMKEDFENANILSKPTLVGTENIKGESSYHYTVTIDKAALAKFIAKSAEDQGQPMTEADMKDMNDGLAKVEIKADVWVGQTSGIINQFSGSANITGSASEGSGTIGFRVTLSDVNKPVTIQAPTDATEFPVEDFLAPFMMGMSGSMDSSMMDSSSGTSLSGSEMDSGSGMVGGDAVAPAPETTPAPAPAPAPAAVDLGGDY